MPEGPDDQVAAGRPAASGIQSWLWRKKGFSGILKAQKILGGKSL